MAIQTIYAGIVSVLCQMNGVVYAMQLQRETVLSEESTFMRVMLVNFIKCLSPF